MSRLLKTLLSLVAVGAGAAVLARLLAPPAPLQPIEENDEPFVDDLTEEEKRMLLEELDDFAAPRRPPQS